MKRRARITLIYLTATFLLMGTAFSLAATGSKHPNNGKSSIHQSSDSNEQEPADNETENDNENGPTGQAPAQDHPVNHGLYVSQAAHCQNVDDPTTPASPDFTAPTDCTGKAKGAYVSSVARSNLGKSNHGHHGKP